jgi:hypothetical protein
LSFISLVDIYNKTKNSTFQGQTHQAFEDFFGLLAPVGDDLGQLFEQGLRHVERSQHLVEKNQVNVEMIINRNLFSCSSAS